MSDTGFLVFRDHDKTVISRIRHHAPPEAAGLDILHWLRTADLIRTRFKLRRLEVVSWRRPPTPEERAHLKPWSDRRRGIPAPEDAWLRLLARTEGKPGEILEAGFVEDAYPGRGGHGYVIDLMDNEFQLYRDNYMRSNRYRRWPLAHLPSDAEFYQATL